LNESRLDDRLGRIRGEPTKTDEAARALLPPAAPDPTLVARDPVLFADSTDGADLHDAGEAIRPLAELCLVAEAQTPFLAGIVGPSGSGASFALRRLAETVEGLSAAAARSAETPFLSRVVVIPVDAAGVVGDPACALASAAFAALERDREGLGYAAFADEAARAGGDPRRAAAAAQERLDELSARLESERAQRDEVEAKRARLTETLLYDTPGSRADAFIRASRALIESRLRRFDLARGDATANFRDLVRDLDSVGAATRVSLAIRSIWAYPSQTRLLTLAAIAFAAAFLLAQAGGATLTGWLRSLSATTAPAADWLAAHADLLATAADVAAALGVLAVLLNLWRAFSFVGLLFRGLGLLHQDMRERRHELDASAARLNQRVLTLSAEVEAAAAHAQAAARRAGGAKPFARGPGPAFARGPEAPAEAARAFFVELGRLIGAKEPPPFPTPQRLVFALDNLDAAPPGEAARLLAAAGALIGPGCAGVVACDLATLADARGGEETARRRMEKHFQVVVNAGALGFVDGGRFAARLIGSNAVASPASELDARVSRLIEPLTQAEAALLTALAPLAAKTPRGVKRFLNAYRLARLAPAPKPAIALALATQLSGDGAAKTALAAELARSERAELSDPSGPPELVEATRAARAANDGVIWLTDARAAWEAARRYTPPTDSAP
jgi:hypothetical protein